MHQAHFRNSPLHYLGNRFLTLPDKSGRMYPDSSWLNALFAIIAHNNSGKKYQRCIEPFSGSASWSLAAMEVDFAEEYIINDSNKTLINTLSLIQTAPEEIKKTYASLITQYYNAQFKKDCFLEILTHYNQVTNAEKALLLPFIINHSWGGILFHDANQNILYRDNSSLDDAKKIPYLEEATLSVAMFNQEIDRTSSLLNKNQVTFKSGDALEVVSHLELGDFVALNPPYPENERSAKDKTGMYTELHAPEILHANLEHLIQTMDNHNIHYFMTYGFYNPSLSQYVLRAPHTKQPKNYFHALGCERCAFGMGLDQMYFPKAFSIPSFLKTQFVTADKILENKKLTADEAIVRYQAQQTRADQ